MPAEVHLKVVHFVHVKTRRTGLCKLESLSLSLHDEPAFVSSPSRLNCFSSALF